MIPHICHEEILAALGILPFLTLILSKIRVWWHRRFGCSHASTNPRSRTTRSPFVGHALRPEWRHGGTRSSIPFSEIRRMNAPHRPRRRYYCGRHG
jgi:hypothetical protein